MAGVIILIVGVLSYPWFVPWGGSPDIKVRLALREFDGYQRRLDRLCGTHPLQPAVLSFQQTGIPETPPVDKRVPRLRVEVSVVVPEPATLLLTVTLPELAPEGIYSVWSSGPIPAGAKLRSKGRCERGTMFWTRLESTLPEERLQAALGVGIR